MLNFFTIFFIIRYHILEFETKIYLKIYLKGFNWSYSNPIGKQYSSILSYMYICLSIKLSVHPCLYPIDLMCMIIVNIVAAFRGMHVFNAKHSYASVTDRQTDDGQSDPYVSLCFAGEFCNLDP